MSNSNIQKGIEFWIIPLDKPNSTPYAKVSDFANAGEKLHEAIADEPQEDWVLKPVRM